MLPAIAGFVVLGQIHPDITGQNFMRGFTRFRGGFGGGPSGAGQTGERSGQAEIFEKTTSFHGEYMQKPRSESQFSCQKKMVARITSVPGIPDDPPVESGDGAARENEINRPPFERGFGPLVFFTAKTVDRRP